jgi:hypothetical protein
MLNKVSALALDAVCSRLSDEETGFNPTWVDGLQLYGLPTAKPLVIDFVGRSNNFIKGQVAPDMLEQSSIFTYPLMCVYTRESQQTGTQKFNQFSGVVQVVVELYLTWKAMVGSNDFQAWGSCAESVFVDIFNRIENQDWPAYVVYNGMVQCRLGPLSFAGENWRQRVGCSLLFEVHQ